MRHAKRRKLTTVDFNNALQNADMQPLFGHGSKDPVTYQQTSNGELFYIDDPEVNVVTMATTEESTPQLASPSVSAEWLAVEGVPWSTPADQQSFAAQGKAGVGVGRAAGIQSVSEDHLTYYEVVTKAILGSDANVMKVIVGNEHNAAPLMTGPGLCECTIMKPGGAASSLMAFGWSSFIQDSVIARQFSLS